jgi:hypothetical protein
LIRITGPTSSSICCASFTFSSNSTSLTISIFSEAQYNLFLAFLFKMMWVDNINNDNNNNNMH